LFIEMKQGDGMPSPPLRLSVPCHGMSDAITLRPGTPADVAACGRICFDGFKTFNDQHDPPSRLRSGAYL
jgi:hypothetical protein